MPRGIPDTCDLTIDSDSKNSREKMSPDVARDEYPFSVKR